MSFSSSYNIIIIVTFIVGFSFVVYFGFSSFSYTLLIVVIDCGLEKYRETMWMKCDKVAFKICGVTYIWQSAMEDTCLMNSQHLEPLCQRKDCVSWYQIHLIWVAYWRKFQIRKSQWCYWCNIDVLEGLEDTLPHAITNAMKFLAHLGRM